jgi:hypothetical protein
MHDAVFQGANTVGTNDNSNEYFKKSKLGIKHYDDGEDKPYFKIHRDEKPLIIKRLNIIYDKNNDPNVLKLIEFFEKGGYVNEDNIESNQNDLDKYIMFFNQSKNTSGENFGEYEILSNELFGDYIPPDIELALSHFNTGEEFADYVINKRESGELVTPRSQFKSDAEMRDSRNYYKSFKENKEVNNLNEIKNTINKNYTHFAVLKADKKIVNGWDYRGYDPEDLKQAKKEYFFMDIIDMDINPKFVEIQTRKNLEKRGINPFDTNNWFKFNAEGWQDRNELGNNI